jgi:hypothetical protein
VQTNVLVKEECILKSKNKLCLFNKLPVFYKSCLKTFGSHLVISKKQDETRNVLPELCNYGITVRHRYLSQELTTLVVRNRRRSSIKQIGTTR